MVLVIAFVLFYLFMAWFIFNFVEAEECQTYRMGDDIIVDCGDSVSVKGNLSADEMDKYIQHQEYMKRLQFSRQLVDAELKRQHELQIEIAKIEVLARLQQISASETNVSVFGGGSSIDMKQNVRATATAKSTSRSNSRSVARSK